MPRGGKREGAGRKKGLKTGHYKPDADLAKNRTIKLTDAEWETYHKNGGTKTLRKLIKNNLFEY